MASFEKCMQQSAPPLKLLPGGASANINDNCTYYYYLHAEDTLLMKKAQLNTRKIIY
jgi:hypothetical protein